MRISARTVPFAALLWALAAPTASSACLGVSCSCSVASGSVGFGTYNPLAPTPVDVAANVSVTCTSFILSILVSYEVRLGPGLNGPATNRRMNNGASLLGYNLYTNPARTLVWGDGSGGTSVVNRSYLLGLGASRTEHHPAYGRLPAGQNVSAGAYADTVIATVVF